MTVDSQVLYMQQKLLLRFFVSNCNKGALLKHPFLLMNGLRYQHIDCCKIHKQFISEKAGSAEAVEEGARRLIMVLAFLDIFENMQYH